MTVMFSCSSVPKQEQFVTSAKSAAFIRTTGECPSGENVLPLRTNQTGLNPEHISLFNWNIYKRKKPGLLEDLARLSGETDIMLLQEVSFDTGLRDVLQGLHPYWDFNSAFTYKGIETGVLIASTIKPLESCGQRHIEPVIGLPKTTVITSYPVNGTSQKLVVANIHAINITLGTTAIKKQFDELHKFVQDHNGPLILAGDFNNWNDSRTEIIEHIATELSLSTLQFKDGGRTKFFGRPVDHILYRGLIPVEQTAHQVDSSDHNPISVVFRLADNHNLVSADGTNLQ